MSTARLFLVALLGFICTPAGGSPADTSKLFIDNGGLRLGVDLSAGGSIFYFAEKENRKNLINHYDKGRFIQQSYYGDRDGSSWDGQPWRWNPVQGGGYKGHPSKLLKSEVNATSLYTKSVPKHWASGEDIKSAVMEQWISLHGEIAHIRFKFSYDGELNHAAHVQELPAVYVDYSYEYLVFYAGEKPWTEGRLTKIIPTWPHGYQESSESWAAYVDQEDWGIGVYTPGSTQLAFFRHEGTSGPDGSGCSYFTPLRTMEIRRGLRFEYDVYLTIGNINQIRHRFDTLRLAVVQTPTFQRMKFSREAVKNASADKIESEHRRDAMPSRIMK